MRKARREKFSTEIKIPGEPGISSACQREPRQKIFETSFERTFANLGHGMRRLSERLHEQDAVMFQSFAKRRIASLAGDIVRHRPQNDTEAMRIFKKNIRAKTFFRLVEVHVQFEVAVGTKNPEMLGDAVHL